MFDHSCASLWWPGRRGGIASAACAMAQPWTTVAWARGPRDRTTLPHQRRTHWSADYGAAKCPWGMARAQAMAAGSGASPAARSFATVRASPGSLPGQTTATRTASQHWRLRQRVVHTRWGKGCTRAGELLWVRGLRQLACWGSRGRSRAWESNARHPTGEGAHACGKVARVMVSRRRR
jgi:hypothetical protein